VFSLNLSASEEMNDPKKAKISKLSNSEDSFLENLEEEGSSPEDSKTIGELIEEQVEQCLSGNLEESPEDSKTIDELIKDQVEQCLSGKLEESPEEKKLEQIAKELIKQIEEKLPNALEIFLEKSGKYLTIDQLAHQSIENNDYETFAKLLNTIIGTKIREATKKGDLRNLNEIEAENSVSRLNNKCDKIIKPFEIERELSWIKSAILKGRIEITTLILMYEWRSIYSQEEKEAEKEIGELIALAFQHDQKKIGTLLKKLFQEDKEDGPNAEILSNFERYPVFGNKPIQRNISFTKKIIGQLTDNPTESYIR
jgi:ferritin